MSRDAMELPKVSVCMLAYNHERYIEQAVQSVLDQQTTFPYEIIIGEDCSTDRTRSILLELARLHPDKIRLRLAERNQGANANFMGAFAVCRGQYVSMLEGDDFWTCSEKLQRQVEALDARPDWAICFHPAQCLYEVGLQGPALFPADWRRPEATLRDLLGENFIPTSSVMFRNRLFADLPAWFRDLELGDWPLQILNAEHGNIGFLAEVMSVYRIHGGGMWSSRSLRDQLSPLFKMFTAIDHHLHGKYATSVDQYRLKTLFHLIAQLDAVKDRADMLQSEHIQLGEALSRASTHTQALQCRINELRSECARLAEDNQALQIYVETEQRRLPRRIARSILRGWQHLWASIRRGGQQNESSSNTQIDKPSKAA